MSNLFKLLVVLFATFTIFIQTNLAISAECKSNACLFVADTPIEMLKKVSENGKKSYVISTKKPILHFMGPQTNNYLCYSGERMKPLLQIIQSLVDNGKIDIAADDSIYNYTVLSHHGFTVQDGYELNLVLKSKINNRVSVYSVMIDFCP